MLEPEGVCDNAVFEHAGSVPHERRRACVNWRSVEEPAGGGFIRFDKDRWKWIEVIADREGLSPEDWVRQRVHDLARQIELRRYAEKSLEIAVALLIEIRRTSGPSGFRQDLTDRLEDFLAEHG